MAYFSSISEDSQILLFLNLPAKTEFAPIMDMCNWVFSMRVLAFIMLSLRMEFSIVTLLATETYGPTIEFSIIASFSMWTGGIMIEFFVLAPIMLLLSRKYRLVSRSASAVPQSFQTWTSRDLNFAPLSIIIWKASIR